MDSQITLIINGSIQTFTHVLSVAELIEHLDLNGKRLAVEVNGEIVPRGQHSQYSLNDQDKIEIIHAVGGG